jgi:AAA+ superfamily predicted ATPase
MSQPSPDLDSRLSELQTAARLAEAEVRITRALAETFRTGLDRLADVPPSRRRWTEFWAGKQDAFAEGVSRTGSELLGLSAGSEEEQRLAPTGLLIMDGIVQLQRRSDDIASSRFTLTPKIARLLFAHIAAVDSELLETAVLLLAPPSVDSLKGVAKPMRVNLPRPAPEPAADPETTPEEALFDLRAPEIGFDQVILPAETMREIRVALVQIRKHPLLVEKWGVGERYRMGRGLAFNFAGPPGTGKTLTAEAVARELGRPLMTIKYSGLESKWIGETGKHIAAVFAAARRHEAVLFFDEADAIASRRTANMEGSGRHYNQSVNILLHELEQYEGVVIFATNLAANFDPAFERRIQSHIMFLMPEPDEREQIWRAHLPPRAPLAPDVDLRRLAEDFEMAGGDIRNAMLKAVRLAALEDAPEDELQITQEHLLAGARAVLHARTVMAQSILSRLGDGSN